MAALVMVILTEPFLDRAYDLDSPASNQNKAPSRSTLHIAGSSHVAAKAMVCTTISAAAAGLGVTSASMVLYQHVPPPDLINGALSPTWPSDAGVPFGRSRFGLKLNRRRCFQLLSGLVAITGNLRTHRDLRRRGG
eukprot:g9236.t1